MTSKILGIKLKLIVIRTLIEYEKKNIDNWRKAEDNIRSAH